jgi:undecaprenyl pyrophosphate phosphatase UppP
MSFTRHKTTRARISLLRAGVVSLLAVALTACNPTVSLYGVYVPGWLTAGVAGFVLSYLSVSVLARFAALRPLGESGVFFCSLGAILAYIIWFAFFSRF